MLLRDIKRGQDLDRVTDEAIDAGAEVDKSHVACEGLHAEDEDGVALVLVGGVGDHREDHEQGQH